MKYSKDQVYQMCKDIAPKYQFDPKLIFAVCLQEGEKEGNNFEPDVARLEQGFYRRYVEGKNELATTTEVLLSASYGVMQLMGQSLREAKYFDWFYMKFKDVYSLTDPLSEIAVPKAINYFCEHLDIMVQFGCTWMDVKRKLAGGDIVKMLGLWNGDKTGKYASEVLAKLKRIGS